MCLKFVTLNQTHISRPHDFHQVFRSVLVTTLLIAAVFRMVNILVNILIYIYIMNIYNGEDGEYIKCPMSESSAEHSKLWN